MSKIKSKGGRPIKQISWEELDKLCSLQCTLVEIANWFECSEDTIERACKRDKEMGFAEYFQQKASKGRISLRRKQYELAMSGDRVMLIWLGKQYLGQKDKTENTHDFSDNLAERLAKARKRRNG